jgi:hypothetical protein
MGWSTSENKRQRKQPVNNRREDTLPTHRKNYSYYSEYPMRTLTDGKKYHNIFKILKEKKCHTEEQIQ